jgi:hypothetical protein
MLLAFAVSQGYIYFRYCVLPHIDEHMFGHYVLISNKWFSPFVYRILMPYTAEMVIRVLSFLFVYETAFQYAFMLWSILAISVTVIGSWLYFRVWFSNSLASAGALFVGSAILMIFMDKPSYQNYWSLIEPGFWALGFWCMARNMNGLLAMVVILATINRETGCFISLAYILSNTEVFWGGSDNSVYYKRKWAIIYMCCWLITYGTIRVWLGHSDHVSTLTDILGRNLDNFSWAYFLEQFVFALSFFWVLVAFGVKYAPKQVLKVCRVIPFYLAAVMIFGIWQEMRLFAPLAPLLAAIGLSYVERRTCSTEQRMGISKGE